MAKQAKPQTTPVPKPPKQLKSASQRQGEYVQRLKAKGYVQLSGVFVPAAARLEVREAPALEGGEAHHVSRLSKSMRGSTQT